MTADVARGVLGWCFIFNMALLLWWFFFFAFAHDLMYRMHGRWFKIPVETFDSIHYAGMAVYKIFIFACIAVPYVALRIVA
jgi:hypothetical protein